jgi:predicted Zn-dependent protease
MRTLCTLVCAAAVALAQTPDGAKEAALGKAVVDDILKRTNRLDSPAIYAYVDGLLNRLSGHLPNPTPHYLYLIANISGNALREPTVVPGGHIVVSNELITTAGDEAELAAMLAHVLAHASLRHGMISDPSTVPLVFDGGRSDGLSPIFPPKEVRARELQADLLAVQVLSESGYEPAALLRYVQRRQPDATMARVFSALPPKADRVAALEQAIAALPPRTYSESSEFPAIQAEARRLVAPEPPPEFRRPTLRRASEGPRPTLKKQ